MSLAAVKLSVLEPRTTEPLPDKRLTSATVDTPLISNMPLTINWLDVAIDPLPVKANLPAVTVVEPV